jgi:hypothetical protein
MNGLISFSYESPRHPHAGIAAVLRHLLDALAKTIGERVIGVAPCHRNRRAFPNHHIATVYPRFRGEAVPVEIRQDADDPSWFYLHPDDEEVCARLGEPPFFNGCSDNLYRANEDSGENARLLIRDSLLASSALRLAVPRLVGGDAPCTFLLHDWEAATYAMLPGRHPTERRYLVWHNSYDSGGVHPRVLRDFDVTDEFAGTGLHPTILERVMAPHHIEPEIFVVSQQFAHELTGGDLLQRLMIPHLIPYLEEV